MAITVTHKFVSPKTEQTDPTLVGPNEWNAAHNTINSAYLSSDDYNFSQQASGQNLAVGSNTITLTPIPAGITTGCYLCISGGTGTAEAVPITGWNSATGQVIVTCAYTHSGTWKIQSATCGIQEAINSLPTAGYGGGQVQVASGTWNMCGPVVMNKSFVRIVGTGRVGTLLNVTTAGISAFILSGVQSCSIENFQIQGLGASSSNGFAITGTDVANFIMNNITIVGYASGISMVDGSARTSQNWRGLNVFMNGITGDGLFISTQNNGGSWYDLSIWGDGASTISKGIHITNSVGANFVNCYTNGCAYGITFEPATGVSLSIISCLNCIFEGFTTNAAYGIFINPTGTGSVSSLIFIGGGANGVKQSGIYTGGAGTIQDIVIQDMYIVASGNGGVDFQDPGGLTIKNISLLNCLVEANSSTASNTTPGLYAQGITNLVVSGGVYGPGSYGNGANNQSYGIVIAGGVTGLIQGANLSNNVTGPINIAGSNIGLMIRDCTGYNPVGQSTITVGASPYTYTAGPCAEDVYISGGTVSSVKIGTTQVAAGPCNVSLYPNQSVNVTYTVAPTIVKNVK